MTKSGKAIQLTVIVTVFSVAMGFMEYAVVAYLREIYFPDGFKFPLPPFKPSLSITELLRELSTIMMLIGVGYMAGRNFASRFGWFLYSWAIWDIFYYVFLKIFLDWPDSFMTYDILFLIPVVWIGPVITPIIITLFMIGLAFMLVYLDNRDVPVFISAREWLLFISGSIIIITAFTWDYSSHVLKSHSFSKIWVWPTSEALTNIVSDYIPEKFNWLLYFIGVMVVGSGITSLFIRYKSDFKAAPH